VTWRKTSSGSDALEHTGEHRRKRIPILWTGNRNRTQPKELRLEQEAIPVLVERLEAPHGEDGL